ncbi:ATP-binding protein [uncultured Microscilla sp.]|uniref:ATP-binding protein n=1 Tax=uncultured Microscilla sp. TaxID=432653 RepID=UPI00262F236B|nr:ATP-binding protein [uncultured Microscilla sp.]
MTSILPHHPYYLQDLQWLEKFIHFRCRQTFDDTFAEAFEAIPSWEIAQNPTMPYHALLQSFTQEERIVIVALLANQVHPDLWNAFGKAFEEYGLEPTKMKHLGLSQLTETPYLQATFGTLLFLLGGTKPQEQTKVWKLFTPEAPLNALSVLEWPSAESTPSMNTMLRLSAPVFHQLTTNQVLHPQYSSDFPATLLTTTKTWDDLIVDEETNTLLAQACKWVQYYPQVQQATQGNQRQGYRLLMEGPSGTGKTMAAALLGQAADKPVYRIDISNIVDKYVGETSKKLRRIFEIAEAQDWILFFDEGDALFGKRSEGSSSSNERYANQEVSYLLYKLEEYPGMIFLATNHATAIDQAFQRRFHSWIAFQTPDKYTRAQLWRHFFEKPGYLQLDPAISQAQFRELAEAANVSAAWIEQFYAYCVLQATAKGTNSISAEEMRQYLHWYGCERGHFEYNTAHLFRKQYAYEGD